MAVQRGRTHPDSIKNSVLRATQRPRELRRATQRSPLFRKKRLLRATRGNAPAGFFHATPRGVFSAQGPRAERFRTQRLPRGDCFHATKSNTRGASGCNARPPAFFDVQREAYGRTTRKNAPGFHKKQRVARNAKAPGLRRATQRGPFFRKKRRVARKAGQRSRGLLSRNAPRSILERKAPPREYRPQGPPGPRPGISGPLKVSRPGSRAKKNASRNSPKGKLRKA